MKTRVGIGYDVHRLIEGRPWFWEASGSNTKGLDGHSDADVVLHALCDALFGALGESDIDNFFPTPIHVGGGSQHRFSGRSCSACLNASGGPGECGHHHHCRRTQGQPACRRHESLFGSMSATPLQAAQHQGHDQ